MNLFDQIWSRAVKIGGFIMGTLIMYHEAFNDSSDRPYLYAAALMMMGLQIAESMDKFISTIGDFKTFLKTKPEPPSTHTDSVEEPRNGKST